MTTILYQRTSVLHPTRALIARYLSDARKKPTKMKQKSKPAPGKKDDGDKNLNLMLAALNAPERKEPPISEEERQRRHEIGRNYVIGRFRQHNDIDHDLTCKLYLKRHAIKMLPKGSKIQEEALKIDDSTVPLWVNIPVWTPPIPGFDPKKFTGSKEDR